MIRCGRIARTDRGSGIRSARICIDGRVFAPPADRPPGLSAAGCPDARAIGSGIAVGPRASGVALPVIFLTGHADVATSVKAMKAGAVDSWKSRSSGTRCSRRSGARWRAMPRSAWREEVAAEARAWRCCPSREREVFDRIVAGKLNRQIAEELGIALRTVKAHRAQLMAKLGVESAAQLGRSPNIRPASNGKISAEGSVGHRPRASVQAHR